MYILIFVKLLEQTCHTVNVQTMIFCSLGTFSHTLTFLPSRTHPSFLQDYPLSQLLKITLLPSSPPLYCRHGVYTSHQGGTGLPVSPLALLFLFHFLTLYIIISLYITCIMLCIIIIYITCNNKHLYNNNM